MDLDFLIERIRKEEVALFIGSGCSLYAGYIGATALRNLIRESAEEFCDDASEKQSLKDKTLEEIAECLIRYSGNRNILNSILVSEYGKAPTSTLMHDRLGRIPHFDHIFTTNYDTLIEDSMDKRCYIIGSEHNFPLQNNNLPKVYKLHGDVNHLDNIIIAKSDYARNISGQNQNLLWNRFSDTLASKDILFIGHGNEDSNIWEVFNHISSRLVDHKRYKFIISPQIPLHQQNLLNEKGFTYFNLDAEQFLDILHPKLIEYAVSDLEDKVLSVGTFERFLGFNDRSVIIKSESQKISVEAIMERDGKVHSEINFTIKENVYQDFMKFNNGEVRSRSFTLQQNDLVEFKMALSGFKLPLDHNKMASVEVFHVAESESLSIESEDGKIEFHKLQAEKFQFADGTDLEFRLHNTVFTFSFTLSEDSIGFNTSMRFQFPDHFSSVKDATEVIDLIYYLCIGEKINLYLDHVGPLEIKSQTPKDIHFDGWSCPSLIWHFDQLRFLEKKLKIRFQRIALELITQKVVNEINILFNIFKYGFIEEEFEKIIILPDELERQNDTTDPNVQDHSTSLIVEVPYEPEFYGTKLPTLYAKIEILDHEFLQHEQYFGIRSKSKRIRHKFLNHSEFIQFQTSKKQLIQTAQLVKNKGQIDQ
ncbi:SIR2 family protein [Pedobacter sp. Hv1]|uniref:SIR2 family NAD-dependent protein deacylase n=1 Tax=Pedobacter sp. Hv1 TaxID=1740090 RepID=UPI0006D897E3|nr:SIR2 family protein [Pedobacter sp. Hv1]KQB99201.1 hypothetical protein AQF98_16615 [Pedobacter sp. Hv1]